MKSTTVLTRSEKRTFRAPLIQNECSDIDCLSLFVALHVLQNVPILVAELPCFTADDCVDHQRQTYLALQHKEVVFTHRLLPPLDGGLLCRSETSKGLKHLFSTRGKQYDCRVAVRSHLPIKWRTNVITTRYTCVLLNSVRMITLTPYYDCANANFIGHYCSWTNGAYIDNLYTNFLFDCLLLLHGHTLCNITKQGKLVVYWCVCVSVFFLFFVVSWARSWNKT